MFVFVTILHRFLSHFWDTFILRGTDTNTVLAVATATNRLLLQMQKRVANLKSAHNDIIICCFMFVMSKQ